MFLFLAKENYILKEEQWMFTLLNFSLDVIHVLGLDTRKIRFALIYFSFWSESVISWWSIASQEQQ